MLVDVTGMAVLHDRARHMMRLTVLCCASLAACAVNDSHIAENARTRLIGL